MPIDIDEKELYELIKSAIMDAIEEKFQQEVKPRLEEIDRILELLDEEVLPSVSPDNLSEDAAEIKPPPQGERE